MATNRRLCRTRDAWLGGVCGGLAKYFDWDPTIVRLLYLVLTFSSLFAGIPIYIVLWILMPPERYDRSY
ncbi:MAG: PspC domain-containing protein [Porphyromonas sp.]|uniref:PspC domain-containing protein n=1 Tax=Porphyromonas sp. TaxID=1924944 RepID=UPI001A53E508|nr:PspC domain-containing protein [Porphyromonas sp.]MBL6452977.1 PspC domain-containing protein [Porphyromonas sp.]